MDATLEVMQDTADAAAEMAVGAAAMLGDVADSVDAGRHIGRKLVKLLIILLLIGAVVGAVSKMRGSSQAGPTEAAS